ncbi:taste receptor type 2 member 40-like [Rana temporaria]|uniref:taste receptor type 2 member 40-like n=1 Tax=Rana temporaria TaxID=8407 RepID=UPI001AAE038C|nr:taste receptor type 2 member 40-like [Rana temporaria]
MATGFILALSALQVAALLVGFATNGFLLGVNLSDWKQRGDITAADHFICAVGFSNLSLQIWLGFNWFCGLFWSSDLFCRSAYALKMISVQCSLTVSGLLCAFYCAKILTFNHALFRLYQRHFLGSYRRIIICSVILCALLGCPLFSAGGKQPIRNKNLPSANGSSTLDDTTTPQDVYLGIYRVLVLPFGYGIPLGFTIVSASLIIVSLKRHTRRMRNTLNTKNEAFVDAHLCARFTVLSLLLLFVMYFITAVIDIIDIFKEGDPGLALCQLVSALYAPAHGMVLIRGNSKLKKASAKAKERIVRVLTPKGRAGEDPAAYKTQH